MATEVKAITAGPTRNRTAIENAAADFPHEMIFGCEAMNKPVQSSNRVSIKLVGSKFKAVEYQSLIDNLYSQFERDT